MVRVTPPPLYPHWNSLWYPLDRRLGGVQSRSGRDGEGKEPVSLLGIVQPCRQSPILSELSRLLSVPERVVRWMLFVNQSLLITFFWRLFNGNGKNCPKIMPMFLARRVYAGGPWWVPGALSLGIKRPRVPRSEYAELYCHSPIRFMPWCLVKHRDF